MTSIWIFGIFTILICSTTNFVYGQVSTGQNSQNPVGAYRVFPKTSFSCSGRPAGYYADVETECEVYHMCDGLGRQFSYSCPNTTLFQQRMLICDHWYMVNCSKAEGDYAANLLIGQRDKPFVPEEENQLRTPRPDLLDRPYAPDYSGESFRKQFKLLPPIQNQIHENGNHKSFDKSQTNQNPFPSPTRWNLQQAIRNDQQERRIAASRRNDEGFIDENSSADLGTSFSTHYNTSADVSSEQGSLEKTTTSNTITGASNKSSTQLSTSTIKVPSKIYEPPFFYPIYNENYTNEYVQSTAAPFQTTTTTPAPTKPLTRPTTMSRRGFGANDVPTTPLIPTLPIRPEILEPKPFTIQSTPKKVAHKDYDFSKFGSRPTGFQAPAGSQPSSTTEQTNVATTKPGFLLESATSSAEFPSSSTTEQTNVATTKPGFLLESATSSAEFPSSSESLSNHGSIFDYNIPTGKPFLEPSPFKLESSIIPTPSRDLLPPHPEFVTHDIATTQGPPIYYEWKIPSDALEPPKFDSPIGVDNRKLDDEYDNRNNNGSGDSVAESSNTSFPFAHNPFLSAVLSKSQRSIDSSTKSPTPRSIQQNLPKTSINDIKDIKKNTESSEHSTEVDFEQLQKDFLIPDFLFPLESEGRTGYEHSDILNSFQLKIPERRNDDNPWYGENPDCPECHPSFVKPGTCEPCVKRR